MRNYVRVILARYFTELTIESYRYSLAFQIEGKSAEPKTFCGDYLLLRASKSLGGLGDSAIVMCCGLFREEIIITKKNLLAIKISLFENHKKNQIFSSQYWPIGTQRWCFAILVPRSPFISFSVDTAVSLSIKPDLNA